MFWHFYCLLFVYAAASTLDSSPSASNWLQIQFVDDTHTHLIYVIAPAIADSPLEAVPPLIPIEAGFELLNSYPVVPVSIIWIIFPTTGAGNIRIWFASLSAFTNTTDVPAAIVPLPLPSSVAVLVTAVDWIPTSVVIAPLALISPATVKPSTEPDAPATITLAAKETIYGYFPSIELNSGTVLAYYG